jgi:hypothetical protein
MKFICKSTFLLLFLCGQVLTLLAEEFSFIATVSKSNVGLKEQFQVTFTLNGDGKNFKPPVLKDFFVVAGPSQSTSMQIVNGNMSQSVSYTYVIQPKTEGSFKIGPASIEAAGNVLRSNVVSVTVSKTSANSAADPEEENIQKQIAESLFIKVIPDKTTALRGEGVRVTYKLFSKIDLVNLNLTKMPTLNGFWSQDIEHSKKLELKREVINGTNYITAELKQAIVFPQREGVLELDPMEAETVVRVRVKRKSRGYDPFEDFFNDPFFGGSHQDMNYIVKSDPVKITVKPLPERAPEGYSGAVGNFSMESYIDKPETKSNEPVSLKIKISGSGNLKFIDPVKLLLPPDVESYEPKISDNISINSKGVSGVRTFEYLLIPRHAGNYKIKPVAFSYFSLGKQKYITLTSPEFSLKVTPGADNDPSAVSTAGLSKAEIQLLGKDISFIKTGRVRLTPKGNYLFGSGTYYSILATPFLFLIIFIYYKKKYETTSGNIIEQKKKKATKVAKKRLEQAHKYLEEKNNKKVYDEIHKAMLDYISHKYGIPVSELSRNKIESVLRSNVKNEETVAHFLEVLDSCEFARYAPAGGNTGTKYIYERSLATIIKLEESQKS